jgi:tRNA threonylcarbamoyladenosine biosynthesis protein TsaB
MIILLDTSTSIARLTVIKGTDRASYEWKAERELAKGLLGWIENTLDSSGETLLTIRGIGVFQGPGSFTGLRIGMTVANTLASSLSVPIVAATGERWQGDCLVALQSGKNEKIVLPLYDRDANITKPRK